MRILGNQNADDQWIKGLRRLIPTLDLPEVGALDAVTIQISQAKRTPFGKLPPACERDRQAGSDTKIKRPRSSCLCVFLAFLLPLHCRSQRGVDDRFRYTWQFDCIDFLSSYQMQMIVRNQKADMNMLRLIGTPKGRRSETFENESIKTWDL